MKSSVKQKKFSVESESPKNVESKTAKKKEGGDEPALPETVFITEKDKNR